MGLLLSVGFGEGLRVMGRKKALSPEQELEVCEMYERIERAAPVADAFGVNVQTIYRVLKKHDIPRTHRHPERKKERMKEWRQERKLRKWNNEINWTDDMLDDVVRLYESGMTCSKIGDKYDCSRMTIERRLKERGVKIRPKGKAVSEFDESAMLVLHEQGKSYREIAETLGVGRDVVCKRVAKLGLGGGKGSNSSAGGKACAEKRRAACIKRFKSVADKVVLVDYKARDITVRCVECGLEFTWYKQHWQMDVPCPYCRERMAKEARERKQYELEQQRKAAREWRLSVPRICKECGEPFYSEHESASYCSDKCRRKSKNRAASDRRKRRGGGCGNYRRRMRITRTPATYDRTITPAAVYKKYRGRCCACGCMTYRTKEHAPNRATLDHIIALANNGTHTWDNVQLLCSDCNSAKRDLGQMRLPITV